MNDLAMWLGYAVMVCAGAALVSIVLFALSYVCVRSVNKLIKATLYAYDLTVLRKTMRQLEAEGKVRKMEAKR